MKTLLALLLLSATTARAQFPQFAPYYEYPCGYCGPVYYLEPPPPAYYLGSAIGAMLNNALNQPSAEERAQIADLKRMSRDLHQLMMEQHRRMMDEAAARRLAELQAAEAAKTPQQRALERQAEAKQQIIRRAYAEALKEKAVEKNLSITARAKRIRALGFDPDTLKPLEDTSATLAER